MSRKGFGVLATTLTMTLFAVATLANAAPITLTDENSTVSVDLTSQAGMYNWTVDGVNQLQQQWFWYRVGNTGGEASIDTLTLLPPSATGNTLNATYTGAAAGTTFAINIINCTLVGGTPGSGTADIDMTIRIRNTGLAPLPMHFFQYSNFDLMGSPAGDTVVIDGNIADQTKGLLALSETSAIRQPNHVEVGLFNSTLLELNDGLPTVLNDNTGPLGPGDVTWAVEWDPIIDPGGSFLISEDNQITINPEFFTPEPATVSLLAVGGWMLLLAKRRRRAMASSAPIPGFGDVTARAGAAVVRRAV